MSPGYIYLTIAIIAEVIATSALKASEEFTKLTPSIIVALGYSVAFYMLSLCLKDIPVGIAYAVWSGLGIVLVTLIAWFLYGQKLDAPALIGLGLIIAGVATIQLFSNASAH
ncbi:MAG: multidrug efflux SMR transporter [Myxococcota bacterium]|nr:multidrug efflux SMR transporter [Myxococcota bacterium]